MMIKVGGKIKSLRNKNDVTQERLAENLGITAQAISRWESGSCYPDIENLPAIADFFITDRDIRDIIIFINIAVIDIALVAMYYKMLIKMFRKHVLRRPYKKVKTDYYVEVEDDGSRNLTEQTR